MLSLSTTDVVMLASAPVLMVVVSLFERRWGPVIGGMVAAAPVTALIGLLLVSSNLGQAVAVEMAIRMSGYTPAQVAIAVTIVAVVGRIGFVAGLTVGTVAYGGLAWLSVPLPAPIAVLASVVTLGLALRFMPVPDHDQDTGTRTMPVGPRMIALRAAVSLLTALGLLVIADRFGAAAGGAVGAYPIFTVTLCAFLFAGAGTIGVQRVLLGMVRGLPAYLVFVLVYGLTATHLGVVVGCIVAALACTTCYVLPGLRVEGEGRPASGNRAVQPSA
jgi:hypothetical protein